MRKVKILFLPALIMGSILMSAGCSKSNNNNNSNSKDSVLYSAWQPFNLKFEGLDNNNDSIFDQTITAPAITQSILDKGSVLVYVTDGQGTYGDAGNAGFSVNLNLGQIYMFTYGTIPAQYSWRYIVIPGNIATTNVPGAVQTYTPGQLKTLPYATVSKILNVSATGSTLK